MAARRGGIYMAAAVAQLVVVLALLAGVASAAGARVPPVVRGGGRKQQPPGNSKFVTLTPKAFGHKRNYEVSCSDDGGPACYVGCPKECPNKCLVFCTYCLTFCSTRAVASLILLACIYVFLVLASLLMINYSCIDLATSTCV
jgi:hypothetical protein